MYGVQTASNETAKGSEKLLNASTGLSQLANNIKKLVDQFKV